MAQKSWIAKDRGEDPVRKERILYGSCYKQHGPTAGSTTARSFNDVRFPRLDFSCVHGCVRVIVSIDCLCTWRSPGERTLRVRPSSYVGHGPGAAGRPMIRKVSGVLGPDDVCRGGVVRVHPGAVSAAVREAVARARARRLAVSRQRSGVVAVRPERWGGRNAVTGHGRRRRVRSRAARVGQRRRQHGRGRRPGFDSRRSRQAVLGRVAPGLCLCLLPRSPFLADLFELCSSWTAISNPASALSCYDDAP